MPKQKLCIYFLYKNCTKCIQLMYTKCIQNAYKMYIYHTSTSFCIYFVYKIKRTMPAKFCIQNVYKSLLKCEIHFVYILYTSVLIYLKRTSLTLFIYTTYIQNSYKMYINNCIQNGSLISTYFDLFVVHFLVNHCKQLRLETCWLIIGGIYQINGLLNYIFH